MLSTYIGNRAKKKTPAGVTPQGFCQAFLKSVDQAATLERRDISFFFCLLFFFRRYFPDGSYFPGFSLPTFFFEKKVG